MRQRMVVLTRDEAANLAWQAQLEDRGLTVYNMPCIDTASAVPTPDIELALAGIRDYHWIIFPNPVAVQYFLDLSAQLGLPLRSLTGAWIAAASQPTADAIKSLGLVVNFMPSRPNPATLAAELKRVKSRRILYLQPGPASPRPVDTLRRRSAHVTELPIYRHFPLSAPDPGLSQLVRDGDISHVVFTTPTAVDGFAARLGDPVVLELARDLPAIAIGPSVTESLQQAGFRSIHAADEPSIAAIVQFAADD